MAPDHWGRVSTDYGSSLDPHTALICLLEAGTRTGGSVWAESTPGSGATLLVRIPRTWASASEE